MELTKAVIGKGHEVDIYLINYYEALRTAAGLWEHSVSMLWIGEGVYAALKDVDKYIKNMW